MLFMIVSTLFLISCLVFANVFAVSILGLHYYSQTKLDDLSNQITIQTTQLQASRGLIVDINGDIIAQDIETYTLYAVVDPERINYDNQPAYVVDKEDTSAKLAVILNAPSEYILERLNNAQYQTEFGTYGNNLSKTIKETIETLKLPGLGFITSHSRIYPKNEFAAYLVGFAQVVNSEKISTIIGRMGLEGSYNEVLKGIDGSRVETIDARGYVLPKAKQTIINAVDGNTVVLTLDNRIQQQLESSMNQTVEYFNASQVWGTVMEVSTGKILAWGQKPSMNLNDIQVDNFLDLVSQYTYEPGSTMKSFTYAAAINEGVYQGDTLYNSANFLVGSDENGDPKRVYKTSESSGVIHNVNMRNYGKISLDVGYYYSSNVGIATLLSDYLKPSVFETYVKSFGFTDLVETDSIPEVLGSYNFTYPIEKLTIGFGQGIRVTMLQMMQAYTAIMNDGQMIKPYVVDQIVNPLSNEIIYQGKTQNVGQPISSETALHMQELMRMIVEYPTGSGKQYKVDETNIIAKTGTAQMFIDGAYSDSQFLYNVVVGFPAENPQYMITYAFVAPTTKVGHTFTAPVKELIKQIVSYYHVGTIVPPDPTITQFVMPNLNNHSKSYALNKLNLLSQKVSILGNQSNIINQYPSANQTILNTQRIFLLTGYTDIVMPDMSGYSKKDVLAFFSLINKAVIIDGDGLVIGQSLAAGSLISDQSIEIQLSH